MAPNFEIKEYKTTRHKKNKRYGVGILRNHPLTLNTQQTVQISDD